MTRKLLDGKSTVVMDGALGVGRVIARSFAAEGAWVALLTVAVDGLAAAATLARELGHRGLVLTLDGADTVDSAANRVAFERGGIDVWVNDAVTSPPPATDDPNVTFVARATRAALRHMQARGSGVVIQVMSAPITFSLVGRSEPAVLRLSNSLRRELARRRSDVAIAALLLPEDRIEHDLLAASRRTVAAGAKPTDDRAILSTEVARATVRAALHPRRKRWIGLAPGPWVRAHCRQLAIGGAAAAVLLASLVRVSIR